MKGLGAFTLVSAGIIGGIGLLISTFAYPTGDGRRAVWTSAGIAFVTQVVTFAIATLGSDKNWLAAWGIGMLLRFLVLAAYGFVLLQTGVLPITAALVTLAAAFFVTTLVEPVMMRRS